MRLRRQVYALEEAAVLAPESTSHTGDTTGAATGPAGAGAGAGPGSSNPLDISWLNSRKDTVGKDKEAELWAAAREFVERIADTNRDLIKPESDSEKMQVD